MRSFERWLIFGCSSLVMGISVRQLQGQAVEVSGKIVTHMPSQSQPAGKKPKDEPSAANVVVWLSPLKPGTVLPTVPVRQAVYRLVQKDKMFTPHLLVVPTGSQVEFPNQDPFFHNVFSLFDGRRFDLGLYEAGSTRSVVFSREGVSYIFCNIHSEMSAVVIALATPFYGFADPQDVFHIKGVPAGDYDLHVWIEGQKQSSLDGLTRRVHIDEPSVDLGEFHVELPKQLQHLNKFGQPYEPESHPVY